MMFIKSIKQKIILTVLSLPVGAFTVAQQTNPVAEKTVASGYNQLAILLMIMILVLAFVIWGMGQVLITLGRQVLNKSKNASKILSLILLAGFFLPAQNSVAQNTAVNEIVKAAPNYGGLSQTTFYIFLTVIGMELMVIVFMAFSIKRMYVELLPEKIKPLAVRSKFSEWWARLDNKLFTKAVPVDKEADILLDHDYDGIRELDNALPPWWKYGFYITIGIAFVYLLNFHVLGLGKNPTEEYNAEMENARIEKEIFDANNKDKIDEKNVPMANAAGIQAGQTIFEANCVACHLKDGGGNVGPNLTDDYWLHMGSLNDIYNTITYGYPDKGMQAWNTKFNPKEISQIASFIKTLKGTKPAIAKLPQGDMYDETIAAPGAVDSAKLIKPDSASSAKIK